MELGTPPAAPILSFCPVSENFQVVVSSSGHFAAASAVIFPARPPIPVLRRRRLCWIDLLTIQLSRLHASVRTRPGAPGITLIDCIAADAFVQFGVKIFFLVVS